jgi:N utilization substance protein A
MQVDNLNIVIDQVAKDKSIERGTIVEALEQAILTAAKKVFGYDRELEAVFNPELGQAELFQYMVVVDEVDNPAVEITLDQARRVDPDVQSGDELGFQIFYRKEDSERATEEDEKFGDILQIGQSRSTFGRIAAQTAKQVIIQRVREAERDIVFNEYKDRVEELVTGISRRFERGNVIVDLGRAEAILPTRQQIPRETYRAGDRVQAYVKEINRAAKGPLIVLSRTDPGLIRKLFEIEVPEIYEGIVTIVNVAREPGERAKIAVTSRDSAVDPVGACVGMKGSRVQAVVQELRGEKIDIVPWSPDIAKLVCNAIQPADVSRVLIDEDRNTIELIVPDDQLSLAIGRRGQNVRLASKLVGWKIEINSDKKVEQTKKELWWYMTEVHDVDADLLDYLFKLGYHSSENILNADEEELTLVPGIDEDFAQKLQQLAHEVKKKKEEDTFELPAEYMEEEEEDTLQGVFAASPPEAPSEESADSVEPSPRRDAGMITSAIDPDLEIVDAATARAMLTGEPIKKEAPAEEASEEAPAEEASEEAPAEEASEEAPAEEASEEAPEEEAPEEEVSEEAPAEEAPEKEASDSEEVADEAAPSEEPSGAAVVE